MSEIEVGDVWRRREPQDDGLDEVRVVGEVFMGEGEPPEWTVTAAHDFGEVVQTEAAGILEHCELVSRADPGIAWAL